MMKHWLNSMQRRWSENPYLQIVLSIAVFSTFLALGLYGYLGTFSRYGSDDYCLSAFFLQDDLLNAMLVRYLNASSRYTNILFIGLTDKLLGWYNVAILPALMLSLFVLGLYLLLKEISDMLQLGWSRVLLLFLSLFLAYLSMTQAPDLYETLYWRAGMTSHFAPVALLPFFGAFLVRQSGNARRHSPAFWVQAACFVFPFLIGGLSEPPTAVMVTILGLAICAVWWRNDLPHRKSILILLSWSLLGALAALLVMALAPANSIRMQTPPPGFVDLILRIVDYPLAFIVDTLRTLPAPTVVSLVVPAFLFYVKYAHPSERIAPDQRKQLGILMLSVSVLAYLLIAASFAPSAYGQSYPVPRARFLGRVLMTSALVAEGALLGVLISGMKSFQLSVVRNFATVALILLALYPVRTVQRLSQEIPVYRERAAAWDLREAEIQSLKNEGVQDVIVRFLSGERIQDLGDHTDFRLNRCAAALYGLNTIVAVPMEDR